MKNLVIAGLLTLSAASFAQEAKDLSYTDSESVYTILSETDAYKKDGSFEVMHITNLNCSYNYMQAAKDNPRNVTSCVGYTENGKTVISEKDGAFELYKTLRSYKKSNYSYGSSSIKLKSLTCVLDLVARNLDQGDISVECAVEL